MAIAKLIFRYCNGENNKDLALALVNHPQTPKEILKQLAADVG